MKYPFTETKIATKYGPFIVRVYQDNPHQETVVLRTESLDTQSPVLVRMHSECLTGDLLGSLQCDCGKQLSKSLQLISEKEGVLIYLRQEGRGIGLFNKIKSYQLQAEGYDTAEANVALGHAPDERSYEMAKVVLDDLNISSVRLLTNNPSKVSELAKHGIEVCERVPLLVRPNKHNKRYFETKTKKFQHQFNDKNATYYYQAPVDSPEQILAIAELIEGRLYDPLLQIKIAVSSDTQSIKTVEERNRLESIFKACEQHKLICPVLHISFKDSTDLLGDIHFVKNELSFVERLQPNDLHGDVKALKLVCKLFTADIPLEDTTFHLVQDPKFRASIEKYGAYISLDNSKGRGIPSDKAEVMKQIEKLTEFGLHNICLTGGFGPDQLDLYFDLRRYYHINFSIDAESRLKTAGKLDLEKVKLYLKQLLRFSDPNQEGIEQTRSFLEQHRRTDWDNVQIDGREFAVHPQVFHAGHFPSTIWYTHRVRDMVRGQHSFCEVGCGAGIAACLIAQANPQMKVTATDINPGACENARINSQKTLGKKQLTIAQGDVLDGIPKNQKFDTIFWALPFGYLDPGVKVDFEECQVFDPGYRAIRKFFETAKDHLSPGGQILLGFSSDLGNTELFNELAADNQLQLELIHETDLQETDAVNFQLFSGKYINSPQVKKRKLVHA